jgi:hypothetical protein
VRLDQFAGVFERDLHDLGGPEEDLDFGLDAGTGNRYHGHAKARVGFFDGEPQRRQ